MSARERDGSRASATSGQYIRRAIAATSSSSLPSPPPFRQRGTLQSRSKLGFKKVYIWMASTLFYSVILFPIAVTFYSTRFVIRYMDVFSPIYGQLGIHVIGLGLATSITFIFLVGIFMSSWVGASVLSLGEWAIKKMPVVSYIYSASKQISAAISPDESSKAFKEVAIVKHPRIGEYTFGFITSTVILHKPAGEEELCCVYVPTNHLYLGDILLFSSKDVLRPDLTVPEGIEIVISGGTLVPKRIKVEHFDGISTPRINSLDTRHFQISS